MTWENKPLVHPESVFSKFYEALSIRLFFYYEIGPVWFRNLNRRKQERVSGFPTIYEQKSKLTMPEIWSVILNRSI